LLLLSGIRLFSGKGTFIVYLILRAIIIHRISPCNCFQKHDPKAINITFLIQKARVGIFRSNITEQSLIRTLILPYKRKNINIEENPKERLFSINGRGALIIQSNLDTKANRKED
jgi:hypothetical protein